MKQKAKTTITLSLLEWDNMGPDQWEKVKDIIWNIVDADIVDLGDGCIDIIFQQDILIIDTQPSLYDPGSPDIKYITYADKIVALLDESGYEASVLRENYQLSA